MDRRDSTLDGGAGEPAPGSGPIPDPDGTGEVAAAEGSGPPPDDPAGLERAYRQALLDGRLEAFTTSIEDRFASDPGDRLAAAWHYRLQADAPARRSRTIDWTWAALLALANGVLLWLLSDYERFAVRVTSPIDGRTVDILPTVVLLAAPITAAMVAAFLTGASGGRWSRAAGAVAVLAAACAAVLLAYPGLWPRAFQQQYIELMVISLAVISWVAVAGRREPADRFALLRKTFEAAVVAGLVAIGGALLLAITAGLFDSLGVELPEDVLRLLIAGGAGVIAVLTVALVFDPTLRPADQAFDDGTSRLIALVTRSLLLPAIVVLVVYIAFIPARFREPFENRDVLVWYVAMLFAVLALFVGATPMRAGDVPARVRPWLRRGIIALAGLAFVVGVYALSALSYRTWSDHLTPNRLAFIGWTTVNLVLLARLLLLQARADGSNWELRVRRALADGVLPYAVWAAAVAALVPLLFHGLPADVSGLPTSIQTIVYSRPEPVVLKCVASPHIFVLEDGAKRWVKDIPTFEAQGLRWNDVQFVPCADLDLTPDGPPIPPDAGRPPGP